MKWKIVVPVFLMGIGFVVWANFGKEDNSKYIVQEIEVQNTKQPELKKVVKATLDLHKKKKNKTLECIFAATPQERAIMHEINGSDPFKESLEVLNKHSASLNLNDMQYRQLAQQQKSLRMLLPRDRQNRR